MDAIVRADLAARFASVMATGCGDAFLERSTLGALTLHREEGLTVAWSTFDHIAANARLVLVGITPGRR